MKMNIKNGIKELLELGGFESVDETWISAVEDGLNKLSNN